jgi:gamma-glutamyltranspeptidase/glutathione hydrolase
MECFVRKIRDLLFCILILSAGWGNSPTVVSAQEARPPSDRHQPYNFTGRQGMVVAANPLAAEAGLEMLKEGGNAVDAALATSFALNAAEPFASGLGGGGWMLIYLAKKNKVTVIDYRERAPAAASPRMFEENGEVKQEWRQAHGLAVAVPGAPAGWEYALKHYGTKTLAEVSRRAVELAEQGYPVSPTFAGINKDEYEKLLANAGETTCYLNRGVPYETGEIFKNPDLARTFKLLAEKGMGEFYRGELARKIVEAVKAKGGILTLEDLASFQAREVKPLRGVYKDYVLYTIPPPSSGGLHTIQLLNILETWPLRDWGQNSPAYIHHFSEALRFVFADRERYLGDPDFVSIPTQAICEKGYARRIASLIKPDRVLGDYPSGTFEKQSPAGNTTHLCVVDREGNIVSQTQSINLFFGSGIIPEGTGFLLNDIMDDFSEDPESLNAPRPGRRPLSSMAPLILFKKDRPYFVLGSPGGTRIFSSLVQIILNVVEFGLSLDEAIEAPRFFSDSVRGKAQPVALESRIPEATRAALEKLGHQISLKEAYDKYFGGAQGLLLLRDKRLILGGADSRRDGSGAGY